MRRPGYRYTGTFLSDLVATGRIRITVRCEPCGHERTLSLAAVMADHGDVVLPDALALVTARCSRRLKGLASPGCSAVYTDPVTAEEEAAIKARRKAEPRR